MAAADAELLRRALDLLETLSQLGERMERTIEVMMPPVVPGKAAVLQTRRYAEAREALLREFGAFTGSEVADIAGSRAGNRAELANRWRGQTWFASFQFGPFGDHVERGELEVVEPPMPLAWGPGMEKVQRAAEEADVMLIV